MKISVETFIPPMALDLKGKALKQPICFNGRVRVKKYRVTVEEIEEPVEVIRARIQHLWDNCENHHHYGPLRREAKKVGLELSFDTMKRNQY